MIDVRDLISNYNFKSQSISIGSLASHSMLDIARGAKDEGFRTLAICKKGREQTYDKYFKSRARGKENIGCIDDIIILNDWKEIIKENIIKKLINFNAIIIPHRSLEVYLGYDIIENSLKTLLFGNRMLLRAEERTGKYKIEKNQDYLVKLANIPTPKKFLNPEEIDRPVIVKATKAIGERHFSREFPIVSSLKEYEAKCKEVVNKGETEEERKAIEDNFRFAPIEEYIKGEKINLNFFYSKIHDELELLGTDTRLQFPNGEELAHIPLSLRESLLEKALEMGRKLVEILKKEFPPGIIGPFALQTIADENENLLVYDVSFRIPGSPDTEVTPYTKYLYGQPVSFGRRIAKEIKDAILISRIEEVLS
jgi:5-formaminoimidazole-4-carboxamide-1-(beta)-D-ribofuranosyl 5'-monophosphate synthetase